MFCCRFLSHCIQILRDINTKSEISVDHRSQYRIMLQRSRQLRSEEHTSELQSHSDLVCRLLLEKKKTNHRDSSTYPAADREAPPRRGWTATAAIGCQAALRDSTASRRAAVSVVNLPTRTVSAAL